MIKELLNQFGLKEKEVAVYLATNSLGPCGAARIAKEVSLARQTVYSIIQDLAKRGLIVQSDRRGVKQFFVDPKELPLLLEERKRELEKNISLAEQVVPELLAKQKKLVSLPKIEYYEDQEGLKLLLNSILEIYRRGGEKMFRGYGINKLGSTTLNDFLRDFIRRRHNYGVTTKLFIGEGDDDFAITDDTNRYGRGVKHLKIGEQKAGFYLAGDRIYLFSFDDRVGVMIENKSLAKLFKDIFDASWDVV